MRLTDRHTAEQGDTIIEVIFAVAIFSFVAISCLTIMNQGIAVGERALELTLVRQQISAQAEALRFIHEASLSSNDPSNPHAVTWGRFKNEFAQGSASTFGTSGVDCQIPSGSSYRPFILNARTATIWGSRPAASVTGTSSPPYSQVIYNPSNSSITAAYGIWVESVPSSTLLEKRFIDFHIRACWPAPGTARPMTIGTIVRLYDPAA
jgi:type II secretory pathway pseudopilin PulG